MARQLGPEQRGLYGLVFMAVHLLFTFGHLGLGSAVAYFTGKKSYKKNEILTFVIVSSFVLGIALATIFFFVYPYIKGIWTDIPRSAMLIGLVALPFLFFQNFIFRFLLGMLRVRQSNITNLLRSAFYIVLVALLIWFYRGGLREAVLCFTLSLLLSGVLGFVLFTRDIRPLGTLNTVMLKPFFQYGIKIYCIVVINYLNYRIDILLIKYYMTASDVSYYQIAANLAQRFWYIPDALSTLLFPTLLAMSNENRSSRFTAKICRNNFFLMILLSIAVLIIAKPVIVFLYGSEYSPVSKALFSILWGITIFPFYKFLSVDFAAKKQLGIGILASSIGVAVNVAANIFMIPRYGIIGAGLATSLSYSVLSIVLIVFFTRQNRIGLRELLIVNGEDFRSYGNALKKGLSYLKRLVGKRNNQPRV